MFFKNGVVYLFLLKLAGTMTWKLSDTRGSDYFLALEWQNSKRPQIDKNNVAKLSKTRRSAFQDSIKDSRQKLCLHSVAPKGFSRNALEIPTSKAHYVIREQNFELFHSKFKCPWELSHPDLFSTSLSIFDVRL